MTYIKNDQRILSPSRGAAIVLMCSHHMGEGEVACENSYWMVDGLAGEMAWQGRWLVGRSVIT